MFTLVVLLVIGMLLVNFVVLMLWQQAALRREASFCRFLLDHVEQNSFPLNSLGTALVEGFSFDGFLMVMDASGNLFPPAIRDNQADSLLLPRNKLSGILTQAFSSQKEVIELQASVFIFFNPERQWLFVAQPILKDNVVIGSLGVARSLSSVYVSLQQGEKTALVYLLINVIVFGVIGFFRMAKLIARPVERLVHLADRYNDTEDLLFLDRGTSNEFDRLASSLNGMLAKIETNRNALKVSVEQLSEANQKLRHNQQEMIRAEKLASVGRMAAGLAHEIGNPLGVVQGYLGLLEQSGAQSEEHLDFIRRAEKELQRVNVLIRQMLDFARVSKGVPEVLSLHELLRSVVDMVQVQPAFNSIQIEYRLKAEHDMICVDQDQLRQVFINCLLNSADAVMAAKRGEDGLISVSTDIEPSHFGGSQTVCLCIRICDNGIGIVDNQLDVIFDPFYTTKEPGKGTGLGLSVSLSIIESIGGKIKMVSKEGCGSELMVHLPLMEKREK